MTFYFIALYLQATRSVLCAGAPRESERILGTGEFLVSRKAMGISKFPRCEASLAKVMCPRGAMAR